jgi:hypothetical protein
MIRILGYLNLLDNDMSVFDRLPKDALKLIGMRLDCQSLSLFCSISTNFNRLFCITDELIGMLRNKLQENTRLDQTTFTRKELGLLCRIGDPNSVLSAGRNHSLVRASQRQVFSFGGNQYGQLGLGDNDNRLAPTLIDISDIIAVSAGTEHSLILDVQGQVFSFGNNLSG